MPTILKVFKIKSSNPGAKGWQQKAKPTTNQWEAEGQKEPVTKSLEQSRVAVTECSGTAPSERTESVKVIRKYASED